MEKKEQTEMRLAPCLRGIIEERPVYRTVIRSLNLRRNMTPCERLLSPSLSKRGFLPQVPLYGFVADFYHPGYRLVVEVDGRYHANRQEYDRNRTNVFRYHGNTVLRIPNKMVQTNLPKVVGKVDGCIIRSIRRAQTKIRNNEGVVSPTARGVPRSQNLG